MSKCWYCNNELTSGDNPKHFGICNKCYDEMFKSGDTIIRSLTDKIANLETKLVEKEKEIAYMTKQAKKFNNEAQKYYEDAYCNDFHNQDKIDFAIEQLEKVKEFVNNLYGEYSAIVTTNFIDNQIEELQKQLEEKEKDNQFLKKMYLSEKTKNDNYHTEKYALDKPVEELRKIKLTPKEKEIYYKGFDNCERQFATHIAELQQELKSQPAEIVEKIKDLAGDYFYETGKEDLLLTGSDFTEILDTILKEYQ